MFNTLSNVGLVALRTAVPANEICLEDEVEFYGGNAKKISRLRALTGMDKRRICPLDVTASDLCAYAAQELFKAYPEARNSIDALIFLSQWPDYHQPATACELQHRLNLPQTSAAFDINQGCAGYVYGLWVASALIASGAARNVLLLVGDAHSFGRDLRNRIIAPVFGDAGSATLLTYDKDAKPLSFDIGTDGSGFEAVIMPAGKARIPFIRGQENNLDLVADHCDPQGNPWQMMDTYMDGGKVYNFTMEVVPKHIKDFLSKVQLSQADIDWLILHQANKQIIENIADAAGFPADKVPWQAFSKYGNAASASIPLALCEQFASQTHIGKLLLCGYGIGLSWASCFSELEHLDCAKPIDYVADPNRLTRQQHIERWKKIFKGEAND